MKEMILLYAFVGLMAFNLLATFVYLIGFNQMRLNLRRFYQTYTQKPR